MSINFTVDNLVESRRLIITIIVGLLILIKNEVISIDEAEQYLFNPYSINKLSFCGVDQELLDIVLEGCELENIKRIIPEKYLSTVDDLIIRAINLTNKYDAPSAPKKWIN